VSKGRQEPVPAKPVSTTDGSPQKAAEVFAGRASFDLTRPLSREDVGMRPGQEEVFYYRPDQPFHVRVILAGDRTLAVDAVQLDFDGHTDPLFFESYPGPAKTAPPSSLQIVYRAPSLEDGRAHLMTVARQLELDAGRIDKWYEAATKPPPGPPWGWAWMVREFNTEVGDVTFDLRVDRAINVYGEPDEPDEPELTKVIYELFWQPK
jgi:hypothetical protein